MRNDVIGIIFRHDHNDYEFMLGEFPMKMRHEISEMLCEFDDGNNIAGCRGDKKMALVDANIDYFERKWFAEEKKNEIINYMMEWYYDTGREDIPSKEKIWKEIQDNPEEVIYNLLNMLMDRS